jgi:hypothetical protein
VAPDVTIINSDNPLTFEEKVTNSKNLWENAKHLKDPMNLMKFLESGTKTACVLRKTFYWKFSLSLGQKLLVFYVKPFIGNFP